MPIEQGCHMHADQLTLLQNLESMHAHEHMTQYHSTNILKAVTYLCVLDLKLRFTQQERSDVV